MVITNAPRQPHSHHHTPPQVMAPFTPFFTESMYQNLRRIDPASPPSVHFTSIPPAVPAHEGDAHIEASVERMQRVIDLGRAIRERHNKPIRTPLKRVVVVHEDLSFLKDVSGTYGGNAVVFGGHHACVLLCVVQITGMYFCDEPRNPRQPCCSAKPCFMAADSHCIDCSKPLALPCTHTRITVQACSAAMCLRSSMSGSWTPVQTQCSLPTSRRPPTCQCWASGWARYLAFCDGRVEEDDAWVAVEAMEQWEE